MIAFGALVSVGLGFMMVSASSLSIEYNQETAEHMGSVDAAVVDTNQIIAQRIRVSGWAFDKNNKQNVTTVRATNDLAGLDVIEEFVPDIGRLDVLQTFPNASEKPGFHWFVPSRYYDGLDHTVYFFAGDAQQNAWDYIGAIVLPVVDSGVVGSLDSIGANNIAGWAIDLDDLWLDSSNIPVAVYVDGDFVAADVADLVRVDVENAYKGRIANVGSRHGYNVPISADQLRSYRDGNVHRVEVFALEVSEGVMTSIGVKWPTITEAGMMLYGNPQIFDEGGLY